MKFLILTVLFPVILFLSGCQKEEGEGGAATIQGYLIGKKYNGIGVLIAEYPLAKHDVYIVYGDNTFYDDDIETSYDGRFEFKHLQPGNYTIFLYEKNPSDPSGDSVITIPVTISKKKDYIELGTIDVRD